MASSNILCYKLESNPKYSNGHLYTVHWVSPDEFYLINDLGDKDYIRFDSDYLESFSLLYY